MATYDLLHISHLNLFKNAKGLCDKLVVGVTVDDLFSYKGKQAMIPFEDRIEIVRSCKYMDAAVPQYDMNKLTVCKKLGVSILFVGDDHYPFAMAGRFVCEFDTRRHNYPTVNMESISCGAPVLTFRTGGGPGILDETCGAVVDCDDIDVLEQEIICIYIEEKW